MSELELTALRSIAENEPTQKWGPWAVEESDYEDSHSVYINDGQLGTSYVAERISQGTDDGAATAKFIAAFSPPAALSLLDRLEQAEESTRLADNILRATLEAMGTGPETDPIIKARQIMNRLKQAEQKMESARRFVEIHKELGMNYAFLSNLEGALDDAGRSNEEPQEER